MGRCSSPLAYAAFGVLVTVVQAGAQADNQKPEFIIEKALRSQMGTLGVSLIPQFAQGKLYSCGVEFTHTMQDWIYSQGQFIRVGGSFGVMQGGGKLAAILKVIVHDIDLRTLDLKPSPPANAYFIRNTETSAAGKVSSNVSDTPGGLFVIFQPTVALEMIVDGLMARKVTIAFSRQPGGSDIVVPIDTTVESTDSNGNRKRTDRMAIEFASCAKRLANGG